MFIFIAGSTRSGKSEYAEKLLLKLSKNSKKIYIATSIIFDPEILERIKIHQQRRKNFGFITIEKSHNLGEIYIPENSSVLIESLSVLTANEMFCDGKINLDISQKIYDDLMKILDKSENLIIVSDDVFCDGIIYDDLTEKYMKNLAELHIKLANISDEVIEICSGLPIFYKSPSIILKNNSSTVSV